MMNKRTKKGMRRKFKRIAGWMVPDLICEQCGKYLTFATNNSLDHHEEILIVCWHCDCKMSHLRTYVAGKDGKAVCSEKHWADEREKRFSEYRKTHKPISGYKWEEK